jgi:hypothetical protein
MIEASAVVEDDDEENKFYDFPSEYSSDYNTLEAEPSALEFTTEKLFNTIFDGFHDYAAEDYT